MLNKLVSLINLYILRMSRSKQYKTHSEPTDSSEHGVGLRISVIQSLWKEVILQHKFAIKVMFIHSTFIHFEGAARVYCGMIILCLSVTKCMGVCHRLRRLLHK